MICVGGLNLETMEHVRLKRSKEPPFWPADSCPFNVGDVFLVEYEPKVDLDNPHHREDVAVQKYRRTKEITNGEICKILKSKNLVSDGCFPNVAFAFSGKNHPLKRAQSGAWYAFADEAYRLQNSTGFWRCTDPLFLVGNRYVNHKKGYNIKYVGEALTIEVIPQGTIIRLSTSTIWQEKNSAFLQLSGWFLC